jgi:hypothetical protein
MAAVPPAQVPPTPPIPEDPEAAFTHVLEHIIGLDTAAERERVTINGGVRTINDIIYIEIDSLIECLTQNTSVLSRTKLKTLKIWAENEDDLGNGIDLDLFTPEVCRERQKLIAKTTQATTDSLDKLTTREKLNTFNGLVAPSGFRFRLAKVQNRNGSRNWPESDRNSGGKSSPYDDFCLPVLLQASVLNFDNGVC